jgi:hypothetical protein
MSCGEGTEVRVLCGGSEYVRVVSNIGSVLLTQYPAGNNIEKNEMGAACSTYGGRERCI